MDLDKRQIELKTSKNGKPRVLHFTEATAALIRRFAPVRPKDHLVFPGSVPSVPKDYRASWRVLVGRQGAPTSTCTTSGTTGRASCWWRV